MGAVTRPRAAARVAFRAVKYTEAVEWFEKAAARKPDAVDARLYLGTAYMTQYIPGGGAEVAIASLAVREQLRCF